MNSLDPRVNRLPETETKGIGTAAREQLTTFEVFVQPKEGKPYQHEGAVHAPNEEMAFLLAKETFTRRFTCTSLWVAETSRIHVSAMTEGNENVYDHLPEAMPKGDSKDSYEVFHLAKRGKQHVHFLTVEAESPDEALMQARKSIPPGAVFYNAWAIPGSAIRKTKDEEKEMWRTLPEKKFRDAAAYKGGDKLKAFLERTQTGKA